MNTPTWAEITQFADVVAWPLILAIFILTFRKPIRALLDRVTKLSSQGAEFATAARQVEGPRPKIQSGELRALPGVDRTEAMADLERVLHESLANFPEHDRLDLVVRDLAQSRLDATFGIIYSNIFGSQINLLKRLKQNCSSASIQHVNEYIEEVKAVHEPLDRISNDQYLGYLIYHNLVVRNPEAIELSPMGHDFLLYLHRFSLSDQRAL